jgi:hypothetical protein
LSLILLAKPDKPNGPGATGGKRRIIGARASGLSHKAVTRVGKSDPAWKTKPTIWLLSFMLTAVPPPDLDHPQPHRGAQAEALPRLASPRGQAIAGRPRGLPRRGVSASRPPEGSSTRVGVDALPFGETQVVSISDDTGAGKAVAVSLPLMEIRKRGLW